MRDAHLVGTVNKGAGIYGYPAPTHVTGCTNSNNPAGHSDECKCRREDTRVQALINLGASVAAAQAWVRNHPS